MDEQIGLRLKSSELAQIDAAVTRMRQANPGLRVTRSDAIRQLLHVALAQDEAHSTQVQEPGTEAPAAAA